jgi:hypothetical protein
MDNVGLIFCIVVPLVCIISLYFRRWRTEDDARRRLRQARRAYRGALAALQADLTNADLRQQALALGRAYATLTHNQQDVAFYDDMAVMNDVAAAMAPGRQPRRRGRHPSRTEP